MAGGSAALIVRVSFHRVTRGARCGAAFFADSFPYLLRGVGVHHRDSKSDNQIDTS
jgi:hypothetical protein